jgi:hypothetical protein
MRTLAYSVPVFSSEPIYFIEEGDAGEPVARPNLDVIDRERDAVEMAEFHSALFDVMLMLAMDMKQLTCGCLSPTHTCPRVHREEIEEAVV